MTCWKTNAKWHWGPEQDKSYTKIKQEIVEAASLALFDPNKQTTVSADASSYGLGAVLVQEDNNIKKPLAFTSNTLNPAETRYAQIEKECFASVWACEKFVTYLRGLQQFKLLTDHKPLVPLINGNYLNAVPVRYQHLVMRMMRYNLKATHVPAWWATCCSQLIVKKSRLFIRSMWHKNCLWSTHLCKWSHQVMANVLWLHWGDKGRYQSRWCNARSNQMHHRRMATTSHRCSKTHGLYAERSHLSAVTDRLLIYDSRIDHFWITFGLFSKVSSGAHPFIET